MTTVKIIISTLILVVLAIFCGSNPQNVCKISFLWFSTPEIPIFVSVLLSFVAGIVVMLPVMLFHGHTIKKQYQEKSSKVTESEVTSSAEAQEPPIANENTEETVQSKTTAENSSQE